MHLHQAMPPNKLNQPGLFVINIGTNPSAPVSNIPQIPAYPSPSAALLERADWQDPETRIAYMEACVEQDIAWQIRLNRQKRSMTQRQLAKKLRTTQTAIARWEDPMYGRHSLPSLIKIANEFSCALSVRLIPYSKFAHLVKDTSDSAFIAASYDSEIKALQP